MKDDKIKFRLAFGLTTYLKSYNHCRFGIQRTVELLDSLQKLDKVERVSVSIATGVCVCARARGLF